MVPDFASLTPRERDCLIALAELDDAKSVARRLNLSPHTVNNHLQSAMRKLEVRKSERAARLYATHLRTVSENSSGQVSPVDRQPVDTPVSFKRHSDLGRGVAGELRESRAVFAFDQSQSQSAIRPLRRGGETANRLSTSQRLFSVLLIALAIGLLGLIVVAAGSMLSTYRHRDFRISSR